MKTVEEVVNKMKEIDNAFPGEENKTMRNSLKIDLFVDVPDEIFCEALRQNNTEWEDFKIIQGNRHHEKKENEVFKGYDEAYSNKRNELSIVAIYYDDANEHLSYVCFEIGNRTSIESYLLSSDGRAISYAPSKDCRYWLLTSNVNGSFLMFRQGGTKGFADIDCSVIDLRNAQYLSTL